MSSVEFEKGRGTRSVGAALVFSKGMSERLLLFLFVVVAVVAGGEDAGFF